MSKNTDLGIYVKKTKKFYYLEYGENYVRNTLDRVKKALMQRNEITNISSQMNRETQYEVISYKDASDSDLEMVPIYISKHIQNMFESQTKKTKKGNFKWLT